MDIFSPRSPPAVCHALELSINSVLIKSSSCYLRLCCFFFFLSFFAADSVEVERVLNSHEDGGRSEEGADIHAKKKKKRKNRWERGWPSLESRGREGQGNGGPPLHKLPLSWSSTFLDNLRAGGRRQRAVIVLDRYERENISLDFSLALHRRSIRGTLTVERSRVGDISFSWEGGGGG